MALIVMRIALKALNRNKLRSGLTMLGMIIGVSAVITMVALGAGAQSSIDDQIQAAGTNMITVRAGSVGRGGVQLGNGAATSLTPDDADAIREQVPGVRYVAAGASSREQVLASGENWSTQVQGTDVEYPLIRFWALEFGEFFSTTDVSSSAKVAVLGSIVRDELFGAGVDPVGESVRIRTQVFRIIGVMDLKGPGAFGEDQDDTVFVPYTTLQKKLLGRGATSIQSITISAASPTAVSGVAEEISALLRRRHALARGADDDFSVQTMEEIAGVRAETTETMTGLLAAIAGVSLLVGGIGIMNIMLVSVTERTREIGLRLAVGARGSDVLLQFLVEAIMLSLVGGLVGIAVGFEVSAGLTRFLAWPTVVPPSAVAAAVGFAAATGIFFGFYPAQRAAHLDPIEALRFE
jgi:putative ABC transport system permease protein